MAEYTPPQLEEFLDIAHTINQWTGSVDKKIQQYLFRDNKRSDDLLTAAIQHARTNDSVLQLFTPIPIETVAFKPTHYGLEIIKENKEPLAAGRTLNLVRRKEGEVLRDNSFRPYFGDHSFEYVSLHSIARAIGNKGTILAYPSAELSDSLANE